VPVVAVVILAGLFLLLLIVLALVAFKMLGARDAQGNVTAPGCINGCAVALALTLLGVVGAVTFVAASAAIAGTGKVGQELRDLARREREVAERRAEEAQERREERDEHAESEEESGEAVAFFRIVLESRDHVEVPQPLLDAISEAGAGNEFEISVEHLFDESGNDVTLVELTVPAEGRDLEELERAISEVLSDPARKGDSDFELRRADELR
jgi:hypothetical protein